MLKFFYKPVTKVDPKGRWPLSMLPNNHALWKNIFSICVLPFFLLDKIKIIAIRFCNAFLVITKKICTFFLCLFCKTLKYIHYKND